VPVPPGIFAIWDGMGLVAKRTEHEPNSDPAMVVIKSVNPAYQTYQRMAEESSAGSSGRRDACKQTRPSSGRTALDLAQGNALSAALSVF
jgi:hypothetical protein